MGDSGDLTTLIRAARDGDSAARDRLFQATYPELRRIARARLRAVPRHTMLDTTALVHECYLRFAAAGRVELDDRRHFVGYAAKIMRSVIVDTARERLARRRGGEHRTVTLDSEIADPATDAVDEILRLHDALDGLAQHDARLVSVVELRYFAGLTEEQIAELLGVTERTVRRDWQKARLLLAESLL